MSELYQTSDFLLSMTRCSRRQRSKVKHGQSVVASMVWGWHDNEWVDEVPGQPKELFLFEASLNPRVTVVHGHWTVEQRDTNNNQRSWCERINTDIFLREIYSRNFDQTFSKFSRLQLNDVMASRTRCILYLEHLEAHRTIRRITRLSEQFKVNGIFKIGHPGYVFIDGASSDVKKSVKSLRVWQGHELLWVILTRRLSP